MQRHYSAFIYVAKDDQAITVEKFMGFLLPEPLLDLAFSSKNANCDCVKQIMELRKFMAALPGVNKGQIPDAEAKAFVDREIGYLVMQIQGTVAHLSKNSLWVNKGSKIITFNQYRLEFQY